MRSKRINWPTSIFIVTYHILLLILLPLAIITGFNPVNILIAAVLFVLCGLSITAGYHRYFSHKTYKANKIVQLGLLVFGTLALQGSAMRWSFEHRLHHKHVDTEKDPYNVQKGLWHAHIGWLFEKPLPIDIKQVKDLYDNPLTRFQDKYYVLLTFSANIGLTLLLGWLTADMLGAFAFQLARIFALHHSTWFINSLAHYWGEKTYSKELSAMDNFILAFLTFGEGYHNFHHCFASDYRNGIKWYHFDPTKWLIWSLQRFGLVKDLRTVDALTIRKKMVQEDKKLIIEHIAGHTHAHVWQEKLHDISEKINASIAALKVEAEKIQHAKKYNNKPLIKQIQLKQKELQAQMTVEWNNWQKLLGEISKQVVIAH